MKVLMINGSPDPKGCIHTAMSEVAKIFDQQGVQSEEILIGRKDIRGCTGCRYCKTTGKCVFNDLVNQTLPKLEEADGIILGSPVYYGNPNGTLLSFAQRLFYSSEADLTMKVGASIVSCRRGGNSASYQALNQFFSISGMPIAPSLYWNDVHGYTAEDVYEDEEGVQTMWNLANAMVFMMRSLADGRERYGSPELRKTLFTNFVR
ncbi:flavodoxin family protein [Parafannyhessea umbonata]|uniref:Multimeric flavodoxin WrbA n=1 Tax=Parafannyhessea umbonata TaxID=604330 RepID=A0A1G6MMD3_9ACTN|nr:flavodoxin family protein [Parafannyhessea umbonata]SDC56672.1 Multimeric flavodoxin WrbA [Parafannyhessea umbonata]